MLFAFKYLSHLFFFSNFKLKDMLLLIYEVISTHRGLPKWLSVPVLNFRKKHNDASALSQCLWQIEVNIILLIIFSLSFVEAYTISTPSIVHEPLPTWTVQSCLLLIYSKRSKEIESKSLEIHSKLRVILCLMNTIIILKNRACGGKKRKEWWRKRKLIMKTRFSR